MSPPTAEGVAAAVAAPRRTALLPRARRSAGPAVTGALSVAFLTLVVLLPLAAVVDRSLDGGVGAFWEAISSRQAFAALRLTLILSVIVAAINALAGTLLAWVLVRDDFRGRRFVNALIDLPFALPTIVAGLTLLALYGNSGPLGVNIAYTRIGVTMALLFVTLPFVVRAVQPVLMALDREAEEAAATLGASPFGVFRRIVLPALRPAILAGAALAFARALGEFGSVVLIAGNIPFKTEVASVFIFGQIESDNPQAAAAVSVVLLLSSVILLVGISALTARWSRHARR